MRGKDKKQGISAKEDVPDAGWTVSKPKSFSNQPGDVLPCK